jgi:MoaA/NifB/PqqE/SkfB family radical SAM enzyme
MSQFNETRLTFQDSIFGEMFYYNKNQFDPTLPKINKICSRPFTSVEICQNGEVIVCCFDWLPVHLGNIMENTLEEIWNGCKASVLKKSILDGSYRYCNRETCHYLIAKSIGKSMLYEKNDFTHYNLKFPSQIVFSVDPSCNLCCPSCRVNELRRLDTERHNKAKKIIKSVLDQITDNSHNQPIQIVLDGCGEIFHSVIYREIFETEHLFSNLQLWPNITFQFKTNGVMMTEKIQKKYSHLFQRMESIIISIDAGNKASYDKVRLGGNWDILWKNLNYMYYSLLLQPTSLPSRSWVWQLVLQEDNYESIPELIWMAKKYKECLPRVILSPLLNWGTFTHEEFDIKAVWQPKSDKYKHLLEILNLPEVKDYPNLESPIK